MIQITEFSLQSREIELFSIADLEIKNSRKALIIGNNNSGKSLFLKVLHGEYKHFAGTVLIQEKPSLFYKKRNNSILIDHNIHLFMDRTIIKNITLPLPKVKPALEQKIIDLCNIGELGEIYNSKVKELSLSDQKMIELIRAVVQNPYLILFDDFDSYFDAISLKNAHQIIDTATNNKTIFIAAAKQNMEYFIEKYRIQNGKVLAL